MIETRAYPWKAPKVSRSGRAPRNRQHNSYNHWKSWSADISMVLMGLFRHECDGQAVLMSAVDLDMLFVLERGRSIPDRTNLGKALEDLLQGIVYVNDRQVSGGDVRRVFIGDRVRPGSTMRWEGPERIHFRVTLLE